MVKQRRTLHTSPESIKELKKIQGMIKAEEGSEPSLTELVDNLFKPPLIEQIKEELLKRKSIKVNFKFDGKIR